MHPCFKRRVRVCVIFNPTAKGDRARRFRSHLEGLGNSCVMRETTGPGDGVEQARAAVKEGFLKIVAAGGDGTINEVANGIVQADGLGQVRLGVLPWGSVNVFAKELRIPTRFEAAWDVVLNGVDRVIDLGWMELGAEQEKRCFVQLAGAGLDGRAVELVDWEQKKKLGDLAYVLAAWQALGEDLPVITARVDDREVSGQLVLLGNGRFYGGRHVFFPGARMDDGALDVLVLEEVRQWRILSYGWATLRNRVTSLKGVHYFQTDQLELFAEKRVPVEMEGDAAGQLPEPPLSGRIWVQGRALRVLVAGQ